MVEFRFPRIPYDEVQSDFIRGEIRHGDFDDLEYRRYVNKLVWVEWFTTEGVSENSTGMSGFGAAVHHWKIAAEYPEEYDIVRREFGATTRADQRRNRRGRSGGDLDERRQRAREHASEWRTVQESSESE